MTAPSAVQVSTQLILTIVSGPFEDLSQADLTRLVYWVDSSQSLIVGRSGFGTDVAVRQDPRISSRHFRIAFEGKAWSVFDLGSTHGTYVDGKRVEQAVIRQGDIIHAGDTTFGITVLDDSPHSADASDEPALAGATELLRPDPLEPPSVPSQQTSHLPGSGSTSVSSVINEDGVLVAPLQLVLRVRSGPFGELEQANLSHVLNWLRAGQVLSVGRSHHSDFVIHQDQRMSSRHFEVSCNEQTACVRDLGSSNGTFVNGEQVEQARLRHGDEIRAGETSFEVGIMGGRQSVEAANAPTDVVPNNRLPLQPTSDPRDTGTARMPVLGPERQEPAAADDFGEEPMQVVLNIMQDSSGSVMRANVSRVLAWFGAGQTFAVGRNSTGVDMRVPDDVRMSGLHFELSCDGRRCRLRDLGSSNGTFLNGERVLEAIVRNEDQIRAGRTVFGVAIQGGPALSSIEAEFAVVKPLEDGAAEAAAAGDDEFAIMLPDMDAIFAGIKAKLKARC